MTEEELIIKLNEFRRLPAETEVFEFKEAKNNYDSNKLGKYFSALSNEANLKGRPHAWLIFGIKDKGRTIVGSHFRQNRKDLDNLKGELANKTTNRISFIEIYELHLPEGRIVMFQIPAAPKGIPVAFDGHYYGREGEELSPLNLEEIERIRAQVALEDWSAAMVPDAAIDDLDPAAIAKARENYKNKFPHQAHDIDRWDDITFLNKAKVIIKGEITRTAIILLGKPESEHFISPAETKIRWLLKDVKGNDKDYHIESCPLLLAVDKMYAKIRNLKYRYIKDGTLFPDEEIKYLKGLGLIEGRKPNYVISAKITASLSNDELKAHYIKQRGLDDEHYKNLIVEYLKKFGESPRKNIEKFLRDKLPDILTESQKKNKVTNLLSALRIKGTIRNNGYSKWSPV